MKKIICILMVLCIGFTALTASASDIWSNASDWAKGELSAADSAGIIPDILENKDFTQNITRAEFAAVAVKIYEQATGKNAAEAENPFKDTEDRDVLKAYNIGITTGTAEDMFEPDKSITRQEAAAMLLRAYKSVKIEGWTLDNDSEFKLDFTYPEKFKDDDMIDGWAKEPVYYMASEGYIKGTDKGFEPLSVCAREEAVIIGGRMIKKLNPDAKKKIREKYVIACIGGSLTRGGEAWQTKIKKYFSDKMPDKDVEIYNAGIGGTTSEYGKVRYKKDVLSLNPDFVIIEFAVNDCSMGSNEERHRASMESMVRQSLKAQKVPGIMFLYAPTPAERGSDSMANKEFTKNAKEVLAKHYGIKSVDVDAYLDSLYEKTDKSQSFMEWLGKYYNKEGAGYNVHPLYAGYALYGDAMIEAFDRDGLENFTVPVKDAGLLCKNSRAEVEASYNYIMCDSSRLSWRGKWYLCTKKNPFSSLSYPVPEMYFEYPYYESGVAYTQEADSAVKFTSSAQSIYVSHIVSKSGGKAQVYVDDQPVAELDCSSPYDNMNYLSSEINLGGGEHTVTIKTIGSAPYRFGAIIERF